MMKRVKKEYQNLIIVIFTILLIIYYYFVKNSYEYYKELNYSNSEKKKKLVLASLVDSVLTLISGIIFLIIAIIDENIDIELAFN